MGSPALQLGKEYPPPNEEKLIERILGVVLGKYHRDYPPSVRPAIRDAHPKCHGCVHAEFAVEPNLPDDLRIGLFAEPRTYPAWIRFSASNAAIRKDSSRDAHGFSVKLMEVPGEKILPAERGETTHDFILANNQVYFTSTLADYLLLTEAVANNRLPSFFFGWNPLKWRLHELKCILQATMKKIYNPLEVQYWSETPYLWSSTAAKYSVKPQLAPIDKKPCSKNANFLQEAMARRLASQTVLFDFMVQLQTDPVRMPIEDSTIVWSEELSPFRKVATIRIPAQNFVYPDRLRLGENLSYTPWHALPEHRPLGGINRTRRVVYEAISKLRHEMNHQPRSEPKPGEVD